MSSIDEIITELASISGALGNEISDRARRPRRGSTTLPLSGRVHTNSPQFNSSEWGIRDPRLWEEEKERTRRAIEEGGHYQNPRTGIEALAWYVSFHDDQRNWGVYIPLSSLALMDELYLSGLPIDRERRLRIAWSALLAHEQVHFALDRACAWFELLLRAPIRREFTARFKEKAPASYLKADEAYLEVEETAANAHMLRKLARRESRRVMGTLEAFVAQQPSGYKEGLLAVADHLFAEAVKQTLCSYLSLWSIEHRLDIANPKLALLSLLPLDLESVIGECPVYEMDDLDEVGVAPGSVRLIQCISEIVETGGFEKQFRRQRGDIQSDWRRKKEEIKVGLPAPPRFEKLKNWNPPTWSIRLRAGHRAHLQPPNSGATAWRAVAIGNHKEMGHG